MPDRQTEMRQMLRALRLPAIAAVYAELALKAAKATLTHEEFLYELLRAECLQRDEHRVARLLRLSGLPPDKTFRTLQLDQFPPLIRQQLERLRSGAFLDDAINVVAAGKPGVGKSHALVAIGHELVLQGHQVLWTPTASRVQECWPPKATSACRRCRPGLGRSRPTRFDRRRMCGGGGRSLIRPNPWASADNARRCVDRAQRYVEFDITRLMSPFELCCDPFGARCSRRRLSLDSQHNQR